MKLLHVDSSPLGDASVSRELTALIVKTWRQAVPGLEVTTRDVAANPPDHLTGELMKVVKFQNFEGLNERQRAELELTNTLVDEFLAADVVVIGAPMYNFSVPTQLKAWVDRIAQAGKTFKYTENGPVGLATGKVAVIASARGGVYSTSEAMTALDHQESFLKTVLGFMGVSNVTVIRAEGVAMGPEPRAKAMAGAAAEIAKLIPIAAK